MTFHLESVFEYIQSSSGGGGRGMHKNQALSKYT